MKKTHSINKLNFQNLSNREYIYLYAGDVPKNGKYDKYIGISLWQSNAQHIKHDILQKYPLQDNCVDIYQSEDVFEHIEPNMLPDIINEIYRVLKPNGIFRLSVPDYRCDILYHRSLKNLRGELVFDPDGGGNFNDRKVINGGHVWFPTYEAVKEILNKTNFTDVSFYHYYDELGRGIVKPIDYSIGHITRTPDNDKRVQNPYRPLSIVLDCIKNPSID